MTALSVRRAGQGDLPLVAGIVNERAAWIRDELGSFQWGGGFGDDVIAGVISGGGTWLAFREGTAVGTVTLAREGRPGYWEEDPLMPAVHLSKLATALGQRGNGLGGLLLRWAVDRAARDDAALVRLASCSDSRPLHEWYRARGWDDAGLSGVPNPNYGTRSALFQRAALPDPAARAMFAAAG